MWLGDALEAGIQPAPGTRGVVERRADSLQLAIARLRHRIQNPVQIALVEIIEGVFGCSPALP